MSNGNIEIDGEVNAGWNSYYDPEKHGTMSETVHGTSEDDLHSEETISLPSEVDTADVTDTQVRIIETAVIHPNSSTKEVAELADVSDSYVKNTLRDNCPEWYDTTFKSKTNVDSSGNTKGVDRDEILTFLQENNGASIKELCEEFNIADNTVQYHLGKIGDKITKKQGVEGYHHMANVYYPVETTEKEGQSGTQEISDLVVAIDAMKATAENEETINALEVVESYL